MIAFDGKPAVYQAHPQPLFRGEAGRTGKDKIHSIIRRFPDTHFAMSKWDTGLKHYVELVSEALEDVKRTAPFDLISFPESSKECVDADGNITITFEDVERVRL